MIAQKLLEGQTYVTISLVHYIIYKIRKGLWEAIDSQTSNDYIGALQQNDLNLQYTFGQDDSGTVAMENLETGKRKMPKVSTFWHWWLSFWSIKWRQRDHLWQNPRTNNRNSNYGIREPTTTRTSTTTTCSTLWEKQGHQAEDKDIFDEINNSYSADTVNMVNDVDRESPVVNVLTAADAELTLYKQVPPIKLKRDDGTFNCPLICGKTMNESTSCCPF